MGKMNPSNIPRSLRPFVPVVERWIGTNDNTLGRLKEAEEDEHALTELRAVSKSWSREQQEAFDGWPEDGGRSAFEWNRFHHFLVFLDALGICPDPDNPDRVQEYIDRLSRFGSPMKDSQRRWASRLLPRYGPAAMRAIPHLKEALSDADVRVRLWAHYALALLDGNVAQHHAAIESIGRLHGEEDNWVRLDVRSALERLSWARERHNLEALCSFSRLGDVENIRRLLPSTDINGQDHNGTSPLQCAVGGQKADVVELLLTHGADPNVATPSADTGLHWAAVRRLGGPIIELLVRYGANVNARNEKGQTPLDRALEFDRKANVELLRNLGGVEGMKLVD